MDYPCAGPGGVGRELPALVSMSNLISLLYDLDYFLYSFLITFFWHLGGWFLFWSGVLGVWVTVLLAGGLCLLALTFMCFVTHILRVRSLDWDVLFFFFNLHSHSLCT